MDKRAGRLYPNEDLKPCKSGTKEINKEKEENKLVRRRDMRAEVPSHRKWGPLRRTRVPQQAEDGGRDLDVEMETTVLEWSLQASMVETG